MVSFLVLNGQHAFGRHSICHFVVLFGWLDCSNRVLFIVDEVVQYRFVTEFVMQYVTTWTAYFALLILSFRCLVVQLLYGILSNANATPHTLSVVTFVTYLAF